MKLDEIKQIVDAATPGPWKHDWGNWDVESQHPDHLRWEIVTQPQDGPAAGANAVHSNMEFIALARNVMPQLLAIAEAAKTLDYRTAQSIDGSEDWTRLSKALIALESAE